ncbi:MAG: hypothetical protein IJ590_03440, partial [Rickettsiales bacterium]|nr:hypothetical protein [Rickettsiales bacterium]
FTLSSRTAIALFKAMIYVRRHFFICKKKTFLLRCPRPRPRGLAPLRSSSLRSAAKPAPRRATKIRLFFFFFAIFSKIYR